MFSALFCVLAVLVAPSYSGLVPRQLNASDNASPSSNSNGAGQTGWQSVPSTQPKPDNTFNIPGPWRQGLPADSADIGPEIYDARSIDIPFRRLQQGNLMYFKEGELNSPGAITDQWAPGQNDFANQSACGIPDNAFFNSKVAIHPYWLKYAPDGLGLDRFCMQDVCINYIRKDWTNDMISKVTDICCTDPNDPSCCATPNDIKIDRTKAQVLYGFSGQKQEDVSELNGDKYPEEAYWIFSKCWDEALVQPDYVQNWWSQPPMPNNENGWQGRVDTSQWQNNQASYPAKGWATYPMGGYMNHAVQPITDWAPGDSTPMWTPVAGGKGYGSAVGVGGSNSTSLARRGERRLWG